MFIVILYGGTTGKETAIEGTYSECINWMADYNLNGQYYAWELKEKQTEKDYDMSRRTIFGHCRNWEDAIQ